MLKLLKKQSIKNNLFLKVMLKKDSKLVAFCAVIHCRHLDKLSSLKIKNHIKVPALFYASRCYQTEELEPEGSLKASLLLGSVLSNSMLLICKGLSLIF